MSVALGDEKPRQRVMVVDDDWLNRDLLEAYLRQADYEVIVAYDGRSALAQIEKDPPDLVLLDVSMPRMDGYEVCRRIKSSAKTRFIPVVMVTALEADEDKIKAIEAGADDFVTKPFNSVLLLSRVRSLLRLKRLHDELEARERLLRKVLSRYVASEVTDTILSDPEKYLKLGGENRIVTIMFADIRGFSAYAERHPAQEVISLLNRVFSRLTPVIFEHRGTLDKYIGDAIMAFFGAPVAHENDVLSALRAALSMQAIFRKLSGEQGYEGLSEMGLGIGLHTGEAAVGNIGSERMMNYTVIGDTVNIARRLQQGAGPGQILISEDTYKLAESHIEARRLEPRKLPGRSETIIVYELLGLRQNG